MSFPHRRCFAVGALGLCLASPAVATAQGLALGPRLSVVGAEPDAGASTRFVGGILRIPVSRRVVFEAAADFRTEHSADHRTTVRERPVQGSLLLFPARAALAPYVLAGYGLYPRTTEDLDAAGVTTGIISERKTGAHIGFGAELFLGRRTAFQIDYRYRFVRVGTADPGETAVNVPGLRSRLSHRGAMWTSGFAFYF